MTLEQAGCNEDCFNCPYPDCVIGNILHDRELERFRRYYQTHRADKLRKINEYNAAHREQIREYNRQRDALLKVKGICQRCRKNSVIPGITLCSECRVKHNARQIEWYRKQRSAALMAAGE